MNMRTDTIPPHEIERAKRLGMQALRCLEICKRLEMCDHAAAHSKIGDFVLALNVLQGVMEECLGEGVIDWTDALDLSEAMLNVQERLMKRREAEIARAAASAC